MSVSEPETAPRRVGGARPGAGRPPSVPADPAAGGGRNADLPARSSSQDIDRWTRSVQQWSEEFTRTGITREQLHRQAIFGLACLRAHAEAGNVKSAIYLVDRLLGHADVSFSETLENVAGAELRLSLLQQLTELDLPPAVAELVASRLTQQSETPESAPVSSVTPALPPPLGE